MSAMGKETARGCRFRIPAEGGRVLWQITNRCNYHCRYCIFDSGCASSPRELNRREAERVIDELSRRGFAGLKITGGEPFTRRDLTSLITCAVERGFLCDVSTNGSLITPAIARSLAGTGVKLVHVGLDGHDASASEAVRGVNTFAPAVRGIRTLTAAGVPVRIGTVIHRANEWELGKVVQLAEGLGAAEIVFSLMEPAGRLDRSSELLAARPAGVLARELDDLAAACTADISISNNLRASACYACGSCPAPARFLYIDNLGRVAPCSWAAEALPWSRSERSLRETSLASILTSPAFRRYRSVMATHCDGCPF